MVEKNICPGFYKHNAMAMHHLQSSIDFKEQANTNISITSFLNVKFGASDTFKSQSWNRNTAGQVGHHSTDILSHTLSNLQVF